MRLNVCTYANIIMTNWPTFSLWEPSCLTRVTEPHKQVSHDVSKAYNFFDKAQDRMINQQYICNLLNFVFETSRFFLFPSFVPFSNFHEHFNLFAPILRDSVRFFMSFLKFCAGSWRAAGQNWNTSACLTCDRCVSYVPCISRCDLDHDCFLLAKCQSLWYSLFVWYWDFDWWISFFQALFFDSLNHSPRILTLSTCCIRFRCCYGYRRLRCVQTGSWYDSVGR